jgi:hypothetical protein
MLPWHHYTTWQPCHLLFDTSYMATFPSPIWHLLFHGMPKREGSTSIYRCSRSWCCHVATSTLFHTKYLTLEISFILILPYKYLLLEFFILAMKHGNYISCIFSILLYGNVDVFHNLLEYSSSMHCYYSTRTKTDFKWFHVVLMYNKFFLHHEILTVCPH